MSARSVLSQIKNPWSEDLVINQFDLDTKVRIRTIGKSGIIVKISMNPKADNEIPQHLKHHDFPVYLIEYNDDDGNACRFWHAENDLMETKKESQISQNIVHTS